MNKKHGRKNGKRIINEMTLVNVFKAMFKDIKSGQTIYLAFSKRNFHILIFTLGMGMIANVVLVDLLIRAPTVIEKSYILVYITQIFLSVAAIISALWLFLKGVNIITDK